MPTRRQVSDSVIRAGAAMQLVFLLLVDWGTIAGFRNEPRIPWTHVIGLIAVNALLLVSALVAWRWMARARERTTDAGRG